MNGPRDADFSSIMRGKVEGWLREEGYQVEAHMNPDARWMFMAMHPVTHAPMMVVQRNAYRDQILLTTGWRLSPELQAQLAALTQPVRDRLLYDLHSPLLLLGVEYEGVSEPFRQMAFTVPLYFDGLSKDLFMSRAIVVRNALHIAQNVVAQALGRQAPK